jgi:hypothetical protein
MPDQSVPQGGNLPTNKWWAARVTAIAAIVVMYITTDGWDDEEMIALVGLIAEAIVSYLVPNAKTVGGAPGA